MARDLAIDLGTANTLVYVRGRGVQLDQPTVIAINERSGDILAMGDEAYAMIGRTPGHIVAVRQGRMLATAFHPEMTGDRRIHKLFVDML